MRFEVHRLAETSHRLLAILLSVVVLSGCTSAVFLAANVPAAFGPFERTANLAYGPEPRQRLDVYVPEAPLKESRAVILFIHGGSWNSGSKDQYRFVGTSLAERGFVAVLPNYRLNPAVRFPDFVADAAAAVTWTLRNIASYGGDPRRVFVMGHSAGAHIALLLTLDRRYLVAAGASADDLRGVIGLSGPYDFKVDSALLRSVFGSAPDIQQTQPVYFRARRRAAVTAHSRDRRRGLLGQAFDPPDGACARGWRPGGTQALSGAWPWRHAGWFIAARSGARADTG